MGISRALILEKADQILSPSLEPLGYRLDPSPNGSDFGRSFWYVSPPTNGDEFFRVISLDLAGFDAEDIFLFAVNLGRWKEPHGPSYDRVQFPKEIPNVTLAPCLWEAGGAMDHKWHLQSENELEDALEDVLEKLVAYGIPFLNDPDSSFEQWLESGMKDS